MQNRKGNVEKQETMATEVESGISVSEVNPFGNDTFNTLAHTNNGSHKLKRFPFLINLSKSHVESHTTSR